MATIYLRSTDGSDSDDGSTWALAKATLAAALTAAGAGGIVYMSQAHAESQASAMTLASPGTAASPVQVLCVNDSTGVLATTGSVSTSLANAISHTGTSYYYGVNFDCAVGTNSSTSIAVVSGSSGSTQIFDTCTFKLSSTGSSSRISMGGPSADMLLVFINTTVTFSHASQGFLPCGKFRWVNTPSAIVGANIPTVLFGGANVNRGTIIDMSGVDLLALGSGTSIFTASAAAPSTRYRMENCKLGSSVGLTTGAVAAHGSFELTVTNCDSADTNYRYYKESYSGAITHESTIVKTGGASDGTTSISRKLVSTANSKFYTPLESDPIVVWNETLSSMTATVEIVTDNVTLTDAECWLEIEYLGTSASTRSSIASDRAASIIATPANQTTSSVTWTTTGLTTPVKQALAVTFTPAEKGPIKARVMLAKASTTVYIDPLITIS